jgi:hypothetical protein
LRQNRAGQGFRLKAETIKDEFNRAPVLHVLLRYTQAPITQMAQTAVEYDRLLPMPLAALRGNSFTAMCAGRQSRSGALAQTRCSERNCTRQQRDISARPRYP